MPLPADTDVSSPKYLRDKYAIVGVDETTYTRGSDMTTRALGIGNRVRMVFSDVSPGLSLPQWTIDESATQPDKPWRYPQE